MTQLRGFKFFEFHDNISWQVLVFEKIESEDKTRYDNFYSSLKAEIIINQSDIDDVFQ